MHVRIAALASSLALAGCIVEAPTTESLAQTAPAAAAARQLPERATLRGGAKFGGKIEFMGGEVTPGAILPTEPSRVTLLFRAIEDLDADYQLFIHVEDSDGKFERFNLDHEPGGGGSPTSTWKKGQTVRDVFMLALPVNAESRSVRVWYGFWHPPTGARLKIDNADAVVNDGRDRALLAQIGVAR